MILVGTSSTTHVRLDLGTEAEQLVSILLALRSGIGVEVGKSG